MRSWPSRPARTTLAGLPPTAIHTGSTLACGAYTGESSHGATCQLVLSENSNLASCRQLVLVDQSAQPVAPTNPWWTVPVMPVSTVNGGHHRQGGSLFRRRNLLSDSLVWAMPVVVAGVAAQDAPEVGFGSDQQVGEALRPDRPHEPLGECVRVRGPDGCLEDLGALGLEHVVEARDVLGVPVADQEPGGDVGVGEVTGDVPGLLGDPQGIGVIGHPCYPDPSAAELDEEQNVETLQQDGVDVEEVRGHDARGLSTQETTPSGTTPPGSRAEAVVLQDFGDGAGSQTHAALAKLTLDAPVAPPRVLPGQARDERSHLFVDGRATQRAMGVRPPSRHQPPVPGQQGCRRHAEGSPGRTGE